MWGKRLNAWNTIPIRLPHRVGVDPAAADHLAVEQDLAPVDRDQQVDALEHRRLPRAGGADQAHHLVLGDGQVDVDQHRLPVERLGDAIAPRAWARRFDRVAHPARFRRRSRSVYQSANRATGTDTSRNSTAATM